MSVIDLVSGAAGIHLDGVTKEFEGGHLALDGITLSVDPGEFLVLVGPSGCGKSTLLRLIAGLEVPSAGSISIGDRDVTGLRPRERDVAMVFQSYALYPHLSVRENIAFGMKARGESRAAVAKKVEEVAAALDLGGLLDRKPDALSGGQRQRVAIGRAIAREPAAFLMDEPLSNLDAKLRVAMRGEISRLHERLGVTTVYVTHDQVEAMTLGQQVALLRDGVLQQVGTPIDLFDRPANAFVAAFIGSPAMNLLEGEVRDGVLTTAGTSAPLRQAFASRLGGEARRVIVGIRPTDLVASAAGSGPRLRLVSVAEVIEHLGTETVVSFRVEGRAAEFAGVENGAGAVHVLAGDDRPRVSAVLPGRARLVHEDPVELTVGVEELYLFDSETGAAL